MIVAMQPGEPQGKHALAKEHTGGFAIRFLARAVDWIVATVSGAVGGGIAGFALAILAATTDLVPSDWMQRVESTSTAHNMLWGFVGGIIYEVVSESVAGTTIGKLVLGLRVVTVEMKPCTTWGAVKRSLGYFVDALFFGLVAYNSMSKSPQNQRVGDKWGETIVARRGALPADAVRPAGVVALGIFGALAAIVGCCVISAFSRVM